MSILIKFFNTAWALPLIQNRLLLPQIQTVVQRLKLHSILPTNTAYLHYRDTLSSILLNCNQSCIPQEWPKLLDQILTWASLHCASREGRPALSYKQKLEKVRQNSGWTRCSYWSFPTVMILCKFIKQKEDGLNSLMIWMIYRIWGQNHSRICRQPPPKETNLQLRQVNNTEIRNMDVETTGIWKPEFKLNGKPQSGNKAEGKGNFHF